MLTNGLPLAMSREGTQRDIEMPRSNALFYSEYESLGNEGEKAR